MPDPIPALCENRDPFNNECKLKENTFCDDAVKCHKNCPLKKEKVNP